MVDEGGVTAEEMPGGGRMDEGQGVDTTTAVGDMNATMGGDALIDDRDSLV